MYSFDPSVNLGGIELNSFRLPQPGKYAFENIAKTENTSPSTVDKGDSFERIFNILNDPARIKQNLQNTLEFQNAQQASAAPYNYINKGLENLAKIPDRIAQQSALQTANTLLGARSITDAYTNTLANYPKLQFASNVPIAQPGKYFC